MSTQTGPTLVNFDDTTTSPSSTTLWSPTFVPADSPRKPHSLSPHKAHQQRHLQTCISSSKPTGHIACDLGEFAGNLWFAKEQELGQQATKHASQSSLLSRREESTGP
ncbi:hypothetical protein NEUTE1DRAFT_135815 [Neurospora tetrasperma FGSC 2508]|uniref:Uncharacterized protein n=1 Tax=Neurospora tetrasperma (strain FGSC 2508 / ATCC MYA-4615 / P0657) TaxID=510951 RepID=F8MGZ5_NEUT8|nr:uncharacterized protein NEUTE1DRAFT_135815 [Neurospora tetrasperma FGSC 2508]EGO58714.1 hypothetical protein NEUTE1DRAFT_135815 [Neurospora tetrasperma FGSC 2508]EGZ72803.1 hypothetical protein NEUTE2DRAFT_165005 [Neurospora tetrasperma FGSC 2509]